MTGFPISNDTKQKMWKVAKYTGYTAGGAVVLASVVSVGLSVVNNLFKPELLSKLGENNIFKVAAAVGFAVLAVSVVSHFFRKPDKQLQAENQQLQNDKQSLWQSNIQLNNNNKILANAINFVANPGENKTLEEVRANQVFTLAQQLV